ncbi:MAG: sigma 54-interacting transcriptional regulator [Candidatus Eisenbacteria bacterium]|nr:sigma 54-interacting transcriptional regulator [Candidatus Eisenbacteria bacterium]
MESPGKFCVGEFLGMEGSVEIWDGVDSQTNEPAILKSLTVDHARMPAAESPLVREHLVLSCLSHSSLQRAIAFYPDYHGREMLILTCGRGRVGVAEWIRTDPPYAAIESWFKELLLVIEYLHNRGVFHGHLEEECIWAPSDGCQEAPLAVVTSLADAHVLPRFGVSCGYAGKASNPQMCQAAAKSDILAASEICAGALLGSSRHGLNPDELVSAIGRSDSSCGTLGALLKRVLSVADGEPPHSVGELRLYLAEHDQHRGWLPEAIDARGMGNGYVSRHGLWSRIHQVFDAHRVATPPIVVVRGERGSGKTRLVEICRLEAAVHGFQTAVLTESGCESSEGAATPYDAKRLCGERAASAGEHTDAEPQQHMGITQQAARGLDDVQATASRLILVDDVDNISVRGLKRLLDLQSEYVRKSQSSAMIMTCTTVPMSLLRWSESDPSDSVVMGEQSRRLFFVDLEPFDLSETTAFINELTGEQTPIGVASWVHSRTDGNPMFIRELLHTLLSTGILTANCGHLSLDLAKADSERLPRSVSAAVAGRVWSLSEKATIVAEVVALGRGVRPSILQRVTGLQPDSVAEALGELVRARILESSIDSTVAKYVHGYIREAVYDGIGTSRAARFHAHIAEALKAEWDGEEPGEAGDIAWHLLRSDGGRRAMEEAFKLALLLAREGRCEDAAECAALLERQVACLDEYPRLAEEIMLGVADVYGRAGRFSDSARAYGELLSRQSVESQYDKARVMWSLGRSVAMSGHPEEARSLLDSALAMASDSEDRQLEARIMSSLAIVCQMQGDFHELDSVAERSIELLSDCSEKSLQASSYNSKGNALLALCQWRESRTWFESAAKLAADADERPLVSLAKSNSGLASLYLGEWQTASAVISDSLALAHHLGSPYCIRVALGCLGTLRLRQDVLDQAESCFREALQFAISCQDMWGASLMVSSLGEIEHKRGNYHHALSCYNRAHDLMLDSGARDDLPELMRKRSECLLSLGRLSEAESEATNGALLATTMGNALEEANCGSVGARISAAEGNSAKARSSFESAISTLVDLGAKYDAAVAQLEFAKWLRRAGDRDTASDYLSTAVELLEAIGARRLIHKAKEELRQSLRGHRPLKWDLPMDPVRLARLHEASSALASPLTVQGVADKLAEIVSCIEPSEDSGVVIFTQGGDAIGRHRIQGHRDSLTDRRMTEIIAALAADLRNEPSVLNEQECDTSMKVLLHELRMRSLYLFPMRRLDRLLGVIYVSKARVSTPLCEQDMRFLDALAVQTVPVLESSEVRRRLQDEVDGLRVEIDGRYGFSSIIGRSLCMQKLFSVLSRVARSTATVLIEGESGTGKELVARAIHHNGPRRKERFIAQNCAALPEQLLESELFGHVRGSFTGAHKDKKGLFEAASCGTFFLDEIADMPLSLQVKLLRVLQDGEIRRVGATEPTNVDIRVIAATNRSLADEVVAGRFREDLYYRLNVVKIAMPPLRERKEDIPLLAQHFLSACVDRHGSSVTAFSKEAMGRLMRYDWPGNVRELENEVERCVALSDNGRVIPAEMLSDRILGPEEADSGPILVAKGMSLREIVEDVEKRAIRQVLDEQGWNKSRAARILGLSRQGLIKKISRFGIVRESTTDDTLSS